MTGSDASWRSRLHHLACGTRDVERLARFYRDVLGLPEIARQRQADGELRSVWLDLGGSILMIERTARTPEPAETEATAGAGAGFFLLALRVDPDERGEFERRLAAAGFAIESRSESSSYTRDPDGNRIAVSHYPEPALSR
jgi:glyoxylase I family protein